MRKNNADTLRWLVKKTKKRIPLVLLMTAANIASAYLGVRIALSTKSVLDYAQNALETGSPLDNVFIHRCGVLICVVVATILLRFFSSHLQQHIVMVLDRDWKRSLLNKLMRGDFARVHRYHSGDLVNRLSSDVSTVDSGIVSFVPGICSMVTRLVAAAVALALLEPLLTAALLGFGLLLLVGTGFIRNRLKHMHKEVSAANGKANSFIQEALEKLLVVQSMDVADEMNRRSDKVLADRFRLQRKQKNISVFGITGITLALDLVRYGALLFCAVELFHGAITFGTLMATTQLIGQVEGPLATLSGTINSYIAMLGSAERLREIDEISEADGTALPETDIENCFRAIAGNRLYFTYPDDSEATLTDFSCTIPKNSFTVITGHSGIGKSTLLKLLLGIYTVDEGELNFIAADGKNFPANDSPCLPVSRATRRMFAYVPQGNLLISGTVEENLRLTAPDATVEELREALRISDFEAVLAELPDGMQTLLGESGAGISEGQAQRLSIARAILRNAPVLLLDEATSSLDGDTEKKVLTNIKNLKDKTVIVVTHRPYALELADQVIRFGEE